MDEAFYMTDLYNLIYRQFDMHIKPTTVKDHVGKIYMKLDIHQREELLPKLLASEG